MRDLRNAPFCRSGPFAAAFLLALWLAATGASPLAIAPLTASSARG